jgi:hypothetical protein
MPYNFIGDIYIYIRVNFILCKFQDWVLTIPSSCRNNLHQNVNFHIRFIVFVFLVLDAVAPPPVAIEGVHWAKDGPKFVYKVDGCDASYKTKYNLV